MSDIKITAPITITKQQISDLLCGAFEGGSNYWYTIKDFIEPEGYNYKNGDRPEFLSDLSIAEAGQKPAVFRHADYPVSTGFGVIITDKEGEYEHDGKKEWILDLAACERGAQIMADKYPKHFKNWIDENDDAETSDVFLQCCLFGEIVFG